MGLAVLTRSAPTAINADIQPSTRTLCSVCVLETGEISSDDRHQTMSACVGCRSTAAAAGKTDSHKDPLFCLRPCLRRETDTWFTTGSVGSLPLSPSLLFSLGSPLDKLFGHDDRSFLTLVIPCFGWNLVWKPSQVVM